MQLELFEKLLVRYAEVRVPGILHFFKDAASAAKAGGSAVDAFYKPLDLRLVVNFITPVKKGENVQLDLELTDDIVKIRYCFHCRINIAFTLPSLDSRLLRIKKGGKDF